jgi:hypothetical protein
MFPEMHRAVVLPTRPEEVVLAPNVDDFLNLHYKERDSLETAKVVIALAEGKGLVALGPKSLYHVQILKDALDLAPDFFKGAVVTNFNPTTTSAAPTAVVQGGQFVVSDWQAPIVVVSGASMSFGAMTQRICLTRGQDFVANVIADRIRALNLR